MSKVIATITTSVDGFVAGPDDKPGRGLGEAGERLHYWVFGGPWAYETEREPGEGMTKADQEFFEELTSGVGAYICGRGMYDAGGGWGGSNPFQGPLWVVTHRVEDQPHPEAGFTFIDSLEAALEAATAAAGDKDIAISGGADVIRQALSSGKVDILAISTAPVILGKGKHLFEGFDQDIDLEIESVRTSPYAVHTIYTIRR
ncbi:MAG TPA: dihydrofolate reductase family protein [Acidimicrobiia bacterium]|nr:dihydrofolate reductase family protein [Acidimicrobiia bacterium]